MLLFVKRITVNELRKVWFEGFSMAVLEGFLGGSKNKYPTIPAIEVAIPHCICLRETPRTLNDTAPYK
jgi:hypothetical protein